MEEVGIVQDVSGVEGAASPDIGQRPGSLIHFKFKTASARGRVATRTTKVMAELMKRLGSWLLAAVMAIQLLSTMAPKAALAVELQFPRTWLADEGRLLSGYLRTAKDDLFTRADAASARIAAKWEKSPIALTEMKGYVKETLRNRRGTFTPEQLYELIPDAIKTSAQSTEEFLRSRDLSHIKSARSSPGQENDIANVIFEKMKWNRDRGSVNMTANELMRVHLDNFAESIMPALRAKGTAAIRGGLVVALLELPVATAENFILVRGQGKVWQDALQDVAKKLAVSGISGTFVYVGIGMLGLPAGEVAVPLAIIGGTVYFWSAGERIWRAVDKVGGLSKVLSR